MRVNNVELVVGQAGFEPTTSSSRTKRATNLRHCPLDRSGTNDATANTR